MSKGLEALEKLSYIPIYEEDEHNIITDIDSCCIYKGDLCEVYGSEVDIIKKDLEVLEILKKYLSYDNKNHCVKMKQIRKSTFNFDYEDLKEWLGNAK